MRKLFLTLLLAPAVAAFAQQTDGALTADGDTDGTYRLIRSCGYEQETPDSSRTHATQHFQHITQQHDATLGKPVFVFHIHALIDDDRGKANVTDRQRNEIKTGPKSPASLVAQEGETMTVRWKFCLPEGFQTTNKFSHIHQLKGIDNKAGTADVGLPLITLTCYTSGSRQVLRIRYEDRTARGTASQATSTLKQVELAPFLGEWVEAEETARFGSDGSYRIVIRRISDGKELLSYENDRLDMWRTDCTGLRPKWGIYRYIGEDRQMESQLRDEQLLFADFSVTKGDASGIKSASVTGADQSTDTAEYTVGGRRSNGSERGIVIRKGKKYLRRLMPEDCMLMPPCVSGAGVCDRCD